jgi:CRP-like cAMP-binding protein
MADRHGPIVRAMSTNDQALQLLAGVDLFEDLSKADLKKIQGLSKELTFKAGEDVITQHGRGGRFYLVTEGEAVVSINGRPNRLLAPGDYFGEMSLIDGEPRSATITARTPLRTFTLASFNFRPLMLKHPTITYKLLVAMSRRVRGLDRDMI